MGGPLEAEYFNWLCAKVTDGPMDRNLMVILYQTEFIWIVAADSHRAMDGLELRQEFLYETNNESDKSWEALPCSLLEFLIAFAQRAQFQTDIPVKDWFWILMTNLNLDEFRHQTIINRNQVDDIIQTFLFRTYDPRGFGGMFPLPDTKKDQREIELWYQWCEWVEYQQLI